MGFFDGAGGALVGGLFGLIGADKANAANRDSVQHQIDFQREMSNSAHSREVADLRNAGLNPLLSMGGSGASSPQGAAAKSENIGEGLAATAMEITNMYLNKKKQEKEIDLMDAQKRKTNIEAKVISKGIPEADLKNKAYDIIRPYVEKISERATGNSSYKDSDAYKRLSPKGKSQVDQDAKQPIRLRLP